MQEDPGGELAFRGYHGTVIRYDATNKEWLMKTHDDRTTTTATWTGEDFPFGIQLWKIKDLPDHSVGKNALLNFNACNASEYGCHDGSCVDVADRCDGKIDCPDKSGKVDKSESVVSMYCTYSSSIVVL